MPIFPAIPLVSYANAISTNSDYKLRPYYPQILGKSGREKKIIDLLAKVKYLEQETFFLIHVEAQSYTEQDFGKRMFKYFARLYEKYDLPIYPVVIFSFDEPQREEPKIHSITFPNLDVLKFEFAGIQLNRISWRDYLNQQNPVAAALMAKMNITPEERPQVKAECLRLLTTLRLDPARMQLQLFSAN